MRRLVFALCAAAALALLALVVVPYWRSFTASTFTASPAARSSHVRSSTAPDQHPVAVESPARSLPAVPPPVVVAPAPPAPLAEPADLTQRAAFYFHGSVPVRWQELVPVSSFHIIGGCTSWSHAEGTFIETTACQMATGHARWVVIHEWGHQVAFKYGRAGSAGLGPIGFPSSDPEVWADCVADVLVGPGTPIGVPRDLCTDQSLQGWARTYIDAPPAS